MLNSCIHPSPLLAAFLMSVEFPFTGPSLPFPLAGNPSSTMPSQTPDQDQMMMMVAGVALGPPDFGNIRCSSICCHNLTQIPRKCMLVHFLSVCSALKKVLSMQ